VNLDLSWNKFTATFAEESLAPVLPLCEQLTELNLSNNSLREEGFIAIVDGVVKGTTQLRTLDLSGNGVVPIIQSTKSAPIIQSIIKLQVLTSLRHLKFLDFHWTEQSILRLSRSLACVDPTVEFEETNVARGN